MSNACKIWPEKGRGGNAGKIWIQKGDGEPWQEFDTSGELVALRAKVDQLERENAALRDTVEDLRRENVGLLADKGRLDWMNSHGYNEKEIKWINDFRAAIDAARTKEGGAT